MFLATGLNFPDALAGGPATGGAPILLTRPDMLPEQLTGYLEQLPNLVRIVLLGGPTVINTSLEPLLAELLR